MCKFSKTNDVKKIVWFPAFSLNIVHFLFQPILEYIQSGAFWRPGEKFLGPSRVAVS